MITSVFHSTLNISAIFVRDDKNVKDDRGEAARADAPGTQTDAGQLNEHYQRAAACPDIRCVTVYDYVCLLGGQLLLQASAHPTVVMATPIITVISHCKLLKVF